MIHNKEVCDFDFKTQILDNSTNNNYFTDFYNKINFEKKKKQFDSSNEQFDAATVLLPRYSKNVYLSKTSKIYKKTIV